MEERSKVKTITPYEASKIIPVNAETIRAGLRQSRFPFGTAIPPERPGGKWKYIIIEHKFLEYIGKKKIRRINK